MNVVDKLKAYVNSEIEKVMEPSWAEASSVQVD
jgi:hypothetical protein